MKKKTRAVVAYIALRLETGLRKSAVYDYEERSYINIDGDVSSSNVNVYDYEAGCHLGGGGNNGTFNLYHYGNNKHIELK